MLTFNDVGGQQEVEIVRNVVSVRRDKRIKDLKANDRFLFVKDPEQKMYIAESDAYNSNSSGEADVRGQYWSVKAERI